VSTWPSLAGLAPVAERLGGDLGAWLEGEAARVGDPDFAALFDGVEIPGVARMDFAHRHVRTGRGGLLGGIRFFGRDASRPFVEVVAHGLEPTALVEVVASEWAAFAPGALRLLVADAGPPGSVLDLTVHAARHGEMARPDGRVTLGAVTPDEAAALVAARYEALPAALRRDVEPATSEELRRWHAAGTLHGIEAAGERVGVIATEPGSVAWIEGDVVGEEVVAARFAGRGLAASAQAALAVARPADRLLLGTIAAGNGASRRTAERAGRPEVLRYVFLPLPGGGAP
jgi:hypothetical protein